MEIVELKGKRSIILYLILEDHRVSFMLLFLYIFRHSAAARDLYAPTISPKVLRRGNPYGCPKLGSGL